MNRLSTIAGHVAPPAAAVSAAGSSYGFASGRGKNPDDVVICSSLRTAVTKANKGGFKDMMPEDLLKPLFEEIVQRTGVDPRLIGDISIGNVLQPGGGALSSRIAQLLAELPDTTPIATVNRQCSSGLQAIANIAGAIKAGYIDIGLAGGVETMTQHSMQDSLNPEKLSPSVFEHEAARNCLLPMGITSENVVTKYGITRQQQDQLAVASHAKAATAQKTGLFNDEIVPVMARVKDRSGEEKHVVIDKDDGIRAGTSIETLSKLKPAFQKGGSTTAGNSSQVSDGAALCLLARRSAAERLHLPIIGKFVSFAVVGVPPEIMGIGPAVAIPAALEQANLGMDDISVFEINEAFASQATYCVDKLRVPLHKLNPKGGAIALGHPLGCTGARQLATLMPELKRGGGRYGVVSMCIGTGMGAAAVIENEQ
ncbi:unnamed protein product [Vitrella brassicaformis CCMP3155]|uniref:acetyl-CoA C-acyltransferase n=3 Tax=Vitrella brassicaformis TaxID=1169539 RepID=A0A0G4F755_VITBC|nr:unnamed protein product [Vitrella brassicaformis CCMP3155]|eukprot:CEM07839.1 unnamed protein product [Vitrella brassicaformis CCMP3155]